MACGHSLIRDTVTVFLIPEIHNIIVKTENRLQTMIKGLVYKSMDNKQNPLFSKAVSFAKLKKKDRHPDM